MNRRLTQSFLIFCAFFISFNYIRPIEAIGEDAILELLEEIRKRMCHPIEKFNLPALDPFEINHIEFEANNKYLVDFKGSITDARVTGLSDFVINELKISSNPLRRSIIDVSLPMTAFKSLYIAKGSVATIVNLIGDGNAAAFLESFNLKVSFQLKVGKYLGIKNLQLTLQIGGFKINLENLMEEERLNEFFHALINELGLELANDVWKMKNKNVEELVQKKINSIIGKYKLSDILKMIGGGNGEPIFGEDDPPADCKDYK